MSETGNIWVKYIMTAQKDQNRKKLAMDLRDFSQGIYVFCWKFSRGPRVQERVLLG